MKKRMGISLIAVTILLFTSCEIVEQPDEVTVKGPVDQQPMSGMTDTGTTGAGEQGGASMYSSIKNSGSGPDVVMYNNEKEPGASETAQVYIPDFPFDENEAIVIDETEIYNLALQYFDEFGTDASRVEFFLGYLPLKSSSLLCEAPLEKEKIARLMGNLYVSGYFGGVWLRDVLFENDIDPKDVAETIEPGLPDSLMGILQKRAVPLIFKGIKNLTNSLTNLAINGTRKTVFENNRLAIEPLMMVYGYNWGYYNYITENPPDGMENTACPLVCSRFLDCEMQNIELDVLEQYKYAADKVYDASIYVLYSYEDRRWFAMRAALEIFGEGSVTMGDSVWGMIMKNSKMNSPEAYELLVDLSGRFMLVSEVTLLPSMLGYADHDLDAGRCGMLQEAAMMVWAGSYFMGLASSIDPGSFPEIYQ